MLLKQTQEVYMQSRCLKLQLGLIGLVIILLKQVQAETQLTGQYLGTRAQGDEHVLLFKLPGDMISAPSERTSNNPLRNIEQDHYVATPSTSRQLRSYQAQDSLVGLEHGEQQISLTIPLASLRPSDLTTSDEGRAPLSSLENLSYGQQSPVTRQASDQPQNVQYITSGLSSDPQKSQPYGLLMSSASEPSMDSSYIRVLPARDESNGNGDDALQAHNTNQLRRPLDHQQQMLNNASLLDQQMRQLLIQRQILQQQIQQAELYSSAVKSPSTTPSTVYEQQQQLTEAPQLWRDSLSSSQRQLASPASVSSYGTANATGAQQVNVDSSQLLSRLAGSSPELLMRLRSMLRKASSLHGRNSSSASSAEKVPSYSDYSDLLGSSQHPADKAMLQNFLQSQNLSSHEEIKIPLVVIAMPRILSLKRDQLIANSQKQSGGPFNTSISGASNLYNPGMASNSAWIKSLASAAAAASANLTAPYLRPTEQLESVGAADQVPTTTSAPHQTMAPYARQFGSGPQQAPIARYYIRPSSTQSRSPGSQVKMAPKPLMASPKSSYLETTLNPIGSHFAYPPSQIAKQIVEQSAGSVHRQQSSESSLSESNDSSSLNRDQILVRMHREPRDQDSNQQVRLVHIRRSGPVQPRTPAAYEYQVQASEDTSEQRQQSAGSQEQSQYVVESSSKPTSGFVDSGLSRLKPLFQARANQENRFSNEQMLNLLARAGRIQESLGGAGAPSELQTAHSVPSRSQAGPKKSPKMVFMIV